MGFPSPPRASRLHLPLIATIAAANRLGHQTFFADRLDLRPEHRASDAETPMTPPLIESKISLSLSLSRRLFGGRFVAFCGFEMPAAEQPRSRSKAVRGDFCEISTEKEDYLVDTIALHDCMSLLRPVFADASICKVFHGVDSDVLWLQRDFHIYVVNMFDTAKACEVLSKPHKSLASLLESYCGVVTNKLFQREDWRQRPLSMEMVQCARTSHYLLHVA